LRYLWQGPWYALFCLWITSFFQSINWDIYGKGHSMLYSVLEFQASFSLFIEISMVSAIVCFALSQLQASFSLFIEISMVRTVVCFALSLNYKLLSVYLLRYLWQGPWYALLCLWITSFFLSIYRDIYGKDHNMFCSVLITSFFQSIYWDIYGKGHGMLCSVFVLQASFSLLIEIYIIVKWCFWF
jgi:hypothetical protein